MLIPETLQRQLGSLFVTTAFLDTFSCGLATNIAMTVGMASERRHPKHRTASCQAAFPLASVLGAAQEWCAQFCVDDDESLEEMLRVVRDFFDILDECNEADRTQASQILEHVYALAVPHARETLKEVQSGFQASGGDLTVWLAHLRRVT